MTNKELLESFEFRFNTREEFERICKNKLLIKRAKEYPGVFVIWDPLADEDGFLITGNDKAQLLLEAVEHLDLEQKLKEQQAERN